MARGVKEAVLEGFPDRELEVLVVWVDVIQSDVDEGAARAARLFDDARVVQFHDPGLVAARAFAHHIDMPDMARVARHLEVELASFEDAFQPGFLHGSAAAFDFRASLSLSMRRAFRLRSAAAILR